MRSIPKCHHGVYAFIIGYNQSRMKILLVFRKTHIIALNLLTCLEGNDVFVIGNQKNCSLSYSRRCRYSYMESLDKINDYCMTNGIEIIIPADMPSLNELNSIRSTLSSPLFLLDDPSKIDLLNNKNTFYEWMNINNISTPYTQLLTELSGNNLKETYPIVIKPTNDGGGNGVRVIRSANELFLHLSSGLPYTKPPLIIQDYISGTDIDVSVLAKNGSIAAYTIQKWCDKGILEFIDNDEALQIAKKIVKLLDYSGLAHFDMRIDSRTQKVYVLECNPRVWGSMAASFMMGVDFMGMGIKLTSSDIQSKPLTYKKGYYVLIGTIGRALMKWNWKYFSFATFRNIFDVLSDPLPYLISEFQILFKLL